MNIEQAILDTVRRLPPTQQEQVLQYADRLQREPKIKPEPKVRMVPSRDRRREMQWIKDNRTAYADQWVVVEGDRLIAANTDGHKAFADAKEAGIDVPFLVHVLQDDSLPFVAGW